VVVFGKRGEVTVEFIDPIGKEGDLHFGKSRIGAVVSILFYDFQFLCFDCGFACHVLSL